MKKIVVGVGVLALCTFCQAGGLVFETVSPVDRNGETFSIDGVSRTALKEALDLHNLMVELREVDFFKDQAIAAYGMRDVQEKKLNALEQCSINKLSDQFQNPEQVWGKMKDEYAKREKDLSIYVNAATTVTQDEKAEFEKFMNDGTMSNDMISERYASWKIGQEILVDVYANPEKWGDIKQEGVKSFSLWEDQKYVYDQKLNRYYTDLNKYFGADLASRPQIGDEKYDWMKQDEVKKANDEYIAQLQKLNPMKAKSLPEELKQFPIAPRPLPPENEMMIYMSSDNPQKQIYPALPEPWEEYAKDGFKNINPNGELAQDFTSDLSMRPKAKLRVQTNRLVAFDGINQMFESAKKMEQIAYEDVNGKLARLRVKLEKYVDVVPSDSDLVQPDIMSKLMLELTQKLHELTSEAEKEMAQRDESEENTYTLKEMDIEDIEDIAKLREINPEAFRQLKSNGPQTLYQQDTAILSALKLDPEGKVFLNEVNAKDMERLVKEAEATDNLLTNQTDLTRELAISSSIPIDDTCLNGGI